MVWHYIIRSNTDDETACRILNKLSAITKNIKHFVNEQDKDGKTPLHYAIRNSQPLTVEFLVEKLAAI